MAKKIHFLYGTMGSAKTLRLLTTAYNFEEKGIPFIVLKPSKDTRDGDNVIKSRIGLSRECVVVDEHINIFVSIAEYQHVLSEQNKKLQWILVDECQFLTEKQIDELVECVDELEVNVMCYGLRTDFKSKLFPASKRLFEIADEIEEIKSTCSCGSKTSINARFDEYGNIVKDGEQIMVGGNDLYRPLCRRCWKKLCNALK